MPAKKNRTCQICQTSFKGRKDAKTCSPACRKRLQRHLKTELVKKTERMESALGEGFHRLAADLLGKHVSVHLPLVLADERGEIAVAEPPTEEKSAETPPQPDIQSTGLPREADKRFRPSIVTPSEAGVVQPQPASAEEPSSIHLEDMMSTESLDNSTPGSGDTTEVEPASQTNSSQGPERVPKGGLSLFRYNRIALMATGMALLAIALISIGSFFLLSSRNSGGKQVAGGNSPSSYAVGNLPLSNIQPDQTLQVGEASQLTINGQLKVNKTLVLVPGSTPSSPVKGQIYYNQTTNQPYYYNGSQFLPLGSQKAVTSLGGAQGNIGVGSGLSLSGGQLTISSLLQQQIDQAINNNSTTGVSSLAGTPGQVIVSAGTGHVTLSLPQSIAVSSTPTFAGLDVSGTLSVSTLQRGSPGNDLSVYAGSDNIAFTANGRTFVLPNTGPSSQTICTTGYTCATGPGTAVELQPGSAQADTGSGSSIYINNTGGGNLLQLQGSGTNSFVVSNGGNITARGDMTLQGGDLVLGTTSVAGKVTFNSGSGTGTGILQLGGTLPTGGVAYELPVPVTSGTQTLCTVQLGNCAGSGSGVTTPGGTAGVIAMFTGSQSIADSILSQAGTTLTTGGNLIVNAANGFSGNLINLEVNGSSKLSVDQAGDTIAAGNLTVNGTGASSVAGNLSVGNGLSVTSGGASITGTTTLIGSGVVTSTLEIQGADALTIGKAGTNTGAIVFRGSGGNGTLTLIGPATPSVGDYTLTIPTILSDDTICTNTTQATACSNYAPAGGSGSYIQNQDSSPQTADFNITGTGTAGTFTATTLNGDGSGVTNLNGSNVASGTIANTYLVGSGALTVTAGTGLSGGGSVALGSSTGLSVVYGSGAGTAVEGNTTLTCASGTGNLGGGGNSVTLGSGGTCGDITITDSPTFSGTLSIQGAGGVVVGVAGSTAGSLTLANGTNTNVSILQAAAPTGTGTATFTLPSIAGGSSDEICTVNAGNCAGSGSGVTTPGGTTGYIPVFTGSQSIADSVISQSGTAVGVAGTLSVSGSGSLALGTASSDTGSIKFYNGSNGNTLTLQAGTTAGNLALTLPTADGSNGQCLQTDGSGALSFNDCTGGAAGGVSSLDGLAGTLTLDNSTGSGSHITIDDASTSQKGIAEFNATNFTAGSGVINTVQDIATTSSPVFASPNATTGVNTGAGAGTQRIDASGNLVNIGTVTTSGAINGQTISSSANFTGTVSIQGANSLALGTASTNTGSIAFYNSAGGNTITIQGPSANPGGDYTLSIPTLTSDDTFCLATLNNCTATGSAGGDLSGSYPDPTVVGIQGNPVVFTSLSPGDVLQYDGSDIVNSKIANANLQGGTYSAITGVGALDAGSIASGFGTISTASNIGTTATLHGDTLTAGSSNQFQVDASGNLTIANAAAVQGTNGLQLGVAGSTPGLLSFANSTNSNLSVIEAAAPTGTGNATFTLPGIAGGSSDEICTVNSGNCAGSGSGVTTPGGTVGVLSYFSGSQEISDSILSQSGTTLTAAGNLVVNAASGFTGNLLNLEADTSSKFSVDQDGNSIQGGTLTVNGTGASSVAGTLSVGTLGTNGDTVLCSNAGTISTCSSTGGSGNFILNGTSPQTADFNITGNGTVGSLIDNGSALFKDDSATAFQVQSTTGTTVLGVDTANGDVNILGDLHLDENDDTGTNGDIYMHNGDIINTNGFNLVVHSAEGINLGTYDDGAFAHFGSTNGEALFKNFNDTTAAFEVQNSDGSNLIVADTLNSHVGINTGSIGLNTNLNVYNGGESTTQTDFTQNLSNAGINLMTDYAEGAYTGGLFWSTQDNNPTSPKAGIYTQLTNSGSELLFGTSSSYAAGLTNTALTIGYNGDSVFRNGTNSAAGFQVQNSTGTGLFTVNTSTGATLTSTLYVDTLGSGGTTAVCWNGSLQISSCASTGSIGFWNRTGTTLSPATAGDNITTTGTIQGGALKSTSLDTATAATLNIGTTTQNVLNIGRSGSNTTVAGGNVFLSGNTSVLSGNTFSVQSGYASITGLSTGSNTTLRVDNHTSTGKILELQDAATDVFTVADGGAVTAKNSTNSAAAFVIQNAGVSSSNLFTADTTNMRIQVGSAGTPVGQLFVSGGAPTATAGSVTVTGAGLQDTKVQGSYAYTIDYSNNYLKVISIANPASPTVVGSATTGAGPQGLYVAGNYAYVVDFNANKLEVFNISNPSAPTAVGTLSIGAQPISITGSGKYVYLGTNGNHIYVVDVSNPVNPFVVTNYSTSTPYAMYMSGNYLYYVNGSATGTFYAIDVSDPANPSSAGSVSVGGLSACDSGGTLADQNVYVSGRYAYVSVCSTDSIKVIDISNPASPTVTSTISAGSGSGPLGVNVQGRYLYAALYGSSSVAIYDVSNPASPSLVGTVNNGASSGPMMAIPQGRYLYVDDWGDSKLNVYDLGGAYIQQFESGSEQTGQLSVTGNSSLGGDVSVQGGITVGGNAAINGALGVGGPALFQNSTDSANAFEIDNSAGDQLLSVDTSSYGNYLGGNGNINIAATTALQFLGGDNVILGQDSGGVFHIDSYNSGGVSVYNGSNGGTGSTTAFAVQKTSGGAVLNVDNQNDIVTVGSGTDAGTLGSELFTGSTHFPTTTGWGSISGNGQSATATHVSGTTALHPTPALAISSGTDYLVTWDITNPNSGGTLTITMGGETLATYNFNDGDSGSYTFSDSAIVGPTGSTANLAFTPNAAFTGTVSNVSVKQVTENWSPAFVVNNTSGGASLQVRASDDNSNMFVGYEAGLSNVNGGGNTALGSWTLENNVTGDGNTAVGSGALSYNVTGNYNVALGNNALEHNTSGDSNIAIGSAALISNLQGSVNVAIGDSALSSNTDGGDNVAIGHGALQSNISSWENVAIGSGSLESFTGAGSNTAVGYASLRDNVSGNNNTSFGSYNLEYTTGDENASFGTEALRYNTSGSDNTAMGTYSLINNTTGYDNVALGFASLVTNTTGFYNTALGDEADVMYGGLQGATAVGSGAVVGSNNTIILGYNADYGVYDGVGIGTSYAQNPFEVAPNTYDTGTISQSSGSGAVTGTGTSFSDEMIGGTLFYPDGGQGIVTAVTDATHLTSSNTTESVSGSDYAIVWGGFNVNGDASVYLQNTTDSSHAFNVVNTSGGSVLEVGTSDSSTALTVNQWGTGNLINVTRQTDSAFTIDNNGNTIFKPTTGGDSATAFQVQDSYGEGMFSVDTSGASVGYANIGIGSTGTDEGAELGLQYGSNHWDLGAGNWASGFYVEDSGGSTVVNIQSGGAIHLDSGITNGTLYADVAGTKTTHGVCKSGTGTDDQQFVACSGSAGADYTEQYPVASGVGYGDIVATGSQMVDTYNTNADGTADWNSPKGQITQLVKSTSAYQTSTIGIVSDNDDQFSSTGYNIKSSDNPVPVALNGRVLVNMAPDSPAIEPGDYLTTSATHPGEAMKATQSGFVIGKALAAWDPASGQMQVMVFVQPGYWSGPNNAQYLQNGDSADFSDLNVSGTATINDLTVTGSANIASATIGTLTVTSSAEFAGDITVGGHIITAGGEPTAQGQTAAGGSATVAVDGTDTTGTITITTGSNPTAGDLAKILFSKTYGKAPHVVLSPSNGAAAGLEFYKGATNATDFMLNAQNAPQANTTYQFDYFIAQ